MLYTIEAGRRFPGPEDQPAPAFYIMQEPDPSRPSTCEIVQSAVLGAAACRDMDIKTAGRAIDAIHDPSDNLYRVPAEVGAILRPLIFDGLIGYLEIHAENLGHHLRRHSNDKDEELRVRLKEALQRDKAGYDLLGYALSDTGLQLQDLESSSIDWRADYDGPAEYFHDNTRASWYYELHKTSRNEPAVDNLFATWALGDENEKGEIVPRCVIDDDNKTIPWPPFSG